VTGTIATEETIKDVHQAGRGIFGKVARLFGRNGQPPVRTDEAGDEALAGLKTGTAVVLQDATTGGNPTIEEIDRLHAEGVKRIDGEITAVNRTERTISIRLADGTRRMLQSSDRAGATVIVVSTDAAGERVVHFFRRAS
jgi:hypothetical protein